MTQRLSWALLVFLVGIGVHSIRPFERVSWSVWSIAFSSGIALCWTLRRCSRLSFCSMLITLFFLGVWRFDATLPDSFQMLSGERIEYVGKVLFVENHPKQATIIVRTESLDRVIVQTIKREELVEGAEVTFTCEARSLIDGTVNEKRKQMLARIGVWYECKGVTTMAILAPPSYWDVFAQLAAARHALTSRIHKTLPHDEAELIAGILYGDQDLNGSLQADIRRAGLMHIVAVSGSNVTIVVLVVAGAVLALGGTRRQMFAATTIFVSVFLIFVGASSSVLRAGFMGWLLLLGRELGRRSDPRHLLLTTAALLSCINPWVLCFDVGFALSFLAMWGLLTWTPLFESHLIRVPAIFGLRASIATTLGATLMTAPYLAWIFGRMTLAGLLTNILVLPLIPWTMLWGAVAVVIPLCALPAIGLARGIIQIAELTRKAPWLEMRIQDMDLVMMIACYVLLWRLWMLFPKNVPVDRRVGVHRLSEVSDKKSALFTLH